MVISYLEIILESIATDAVATPSTPRELEEVDAPTLRESAVMRLYKRSLLGWSVEAIVPTVTAREPPTTERRTSCAQSDFQTRILTWKWQQGASPRFVPLSWCIHDDQNKSQHSLEHSTWRGLDDVALAFSPWLSMDIHICIHGTHSI